MPDSFDHELAGLVKIDFKALDQWLEEMRCVVFRSQRMDCRYCFWDTLTDVWLILARLSTTQKVYLCVLQPLTDLKNAESLTTFLHTDPFHRVDVLPSGRHVKIEIDGVVLADTGTEGGVMSLWETNFPGRWYLPRTAVRLFSLSHPPFPLKLLTDVADQLGIPHPKRNPHWLPLQRRGILLQRRR